MMRLVYNTVDPFPPYTAAIGTGEKQGNWKNGGKAYITKKNIFGT